jgi:hypothetical protein
VPFGTVCRDARDVCDTAEFCLGSAACPPDLFRDETFECRPARSECDLAEICDGREPRCPPDKIAPDDSACDTDACGTERCRDGECIGGFLCRVGEYCACGEFCLPEGSPCI